MAYAMKTASRINQIGDTTIRPARTRSFLSGAAIVGAGTAVAIWCAFAVAMHSLGTTNQTDSDRFSQMRLANDAVRHEKTTGNGRIIRVSKATRLRPWADQQQAALTTDDIRKHGLARVEQARLSLAKLAPPPAEMADNTPVTAPVEVANEQTAAAVGAAPLPTSPAPAPLAVALVQTDKALGKDRIVIPSKDQVAAAEQRELLALAAIPALAVAKIVSPPAPAARSGAPLRKTEQEVASAEENAEETSSSNSNGNATSAFGLVLSEQEADVPLPMARPNLPPAAGGRGSAPVLAYAKAESEDDDDNEDNITPRLRKPTIGAGVRKGVAIYDISAGTVYLPSGERLEAHSGLGKMRDNPRFVSQKMRGPTPPHTYALTMRESLFHGVEAIRLTPLGGSDAIFDRVGLLAHTYMLGARGDSNGCVSFKDYKRFLAAFKRGDIRQLVVVARMSDAPSFASSPASDGGPKKTLASLLFSKS